ASPVDTTECLEQPRLPFFWHESAAGKNRRKAVILVVPFQVLEATSIDAVIVHANAPLGAAKSDQVALHFLGHRKHTVDPVENRSNVPQAYALPSGRERRDVIA